MSGVILVADADPERAKRIEEACSARGLPTRQSPHGAAALETALAELPDVLVATADLPLIDSTRLAEILRANPRTNHLRVLHLGSRAENTVGLTLDDWIETDADPDQIALRAESMVARQERLRAMEQAHETREDLQGKLAQVSLPDLLQLFQMNRRTGTLELLRRGTRDHEERGRIHVREGDVVQASAGPVSGEKAFYRLLGWRDGSFVFGPPEPHEGTAITTPTRTLLLEGVRQLDEWERMATSVASPDALVTLEVSAADLPHPAHPLTQDVLVLLERPSRVQDLLDRSPFPDYQVLRTLQTLVERGMVEISEGPGQVGEGVDSLAGPVNARRLRDWMHLGHGTGAASADAKILLVASGEEALRAFVEILCQLPGVDRIGGSPTVQDFQNVARLPMDGGVGCEFLHVPADSSFTPLWPLAGHGALATIFLLDNPLAGAAKDLGDVRAVLEGLPRSRSFHVLLLGREEPVAVDAVRSSLSLLDESSVFLVSREGGESAVPVVRHLMSRVLP